MSYIRVVPILVAISVLISVSSCSSPSTVAQSSTASTIQTVAIESTAAPTPKPTPTPTPTATPTPIPTLAAAPYEDLDAEMLMSPEIPGLTKQIQEQNDGINKVVYITAVDNVYGLKEGLYAGEFKRNVFADNIETGGVVLIPAVAQVLLQEKLAGITPGEPKISVILPMDITQVGAEDVKVTTVSENNFFYVELSCQAPAMIRWMVLDTPFLQILSSTSFNGSKSDIIENGLNYQGEDMGFQLDNGFADAINLNLNNDNLMDFVVLGIPNGYWCTNEVGNNYHGPAEGKTLFGENIYPNGESTQNIVDIYCFESNGGNAFQISAENLLKAGACLVFLTASPEQNG